jgi:hypothetical protein
LIFSKGAVIAFQNQPFKILMFLGAGHKIHNQKRPLLRHRERGKITTEFAFLYAWQGIPARLRCRWRE